MQEEHVKFLRTIFLIIYSPDIAIGSIAVNFDNDKQKTGEFSTNQLLLNIIQIFPDLSNGYAKSEVFLADFSEKNVILSEGSSYHLFERCYLQKKAGVIQ
jgi:hypothetical protein